MSKTAVVLPEIPEKAFFNIGEVAHLCNVKPHVLRYWEQEFSVLKPLKRRGNRRFYRREDVQVARLIRELLYERGFTINGARAELNKQASNTPIDQHENTHIIKELETLLDILN